MDMISKCGRYQGCLDGDAGLAWKAEAKLSGLSVSLSLYIILWMSIPI